MNRNAIISILILLLLANGWAIVYFQLPFYQLSLSMLAVSLLIMSMIHERFVFLYAITLVIAYAAFLTIYAFVGNHPSDIQLLYIYDHLLFASFMIIFWVLNNLIKRISYENKDLKEKVELLTKRRPDTKVLTFNEFLEQAKWTLTSTRRNQKQAWLVELRITEKSKRTRKVVREKVEELGLNSIRNNFDLITANETDVFILLRDTEKQGVSIVLQRIEERSKHIFNYLEVPYDVDTTQINTEEDIQKHLGVL